MHKQKIIFFITLLFIFGSHFHLTSQIASQTSGCAPCTISFSAAPGSTSWNWNFGNGQTSTLQYPSIVYNTPGTYVVQYSGPGGTPASGQIQIVVSANNITPNITFNVPASHCAPMSVPFTGSSNGGSLFQWAFGDGGLGQGAGVTHAYSLGGIFNATLTVTDPLTGCSGTASAGPINVSIPPTPVITANPGLYSCGAPFTTSLTGIFSTSGSPFGTSSLTYNWNFGNSQTSTQQSPGSVTYNTPGFYNLSLSVTDDNNCTATKTVVVSVIQPTLAATVPASVCILGQHPNFPTFMANIQSSEPSTTWQMGDGNTLTITPPAPPVTSPGVSYSPSVVYTFTYGLYTTPGLKTLIVTARNGSCVATETKTIFVEQIIPEFVAIPINFTCAPSMTVGYTNQSTVNSNNPMSYVWTLDHWDQLTADEYTSLATNPTWTVTQGSLNPYAFYKTYNPWATLFVKTSPLNCHADIKHRFDSIRRPTAWFNKDKRQGCVPLTVRLRDSSDTNTSLFPVQSYTWNNGASPPTLVTGVIPPAINQPTFTYTATGTYTPYLIIKTAGGCIDTSFVDTVIVVNPPTVGMTFTPNLSVCAGQSVQVNMFATPASSVIQLWHAEGDAGFFSGCVSNKDPVWMFTHLGSQGFTISASDHGCESTSVPAMTVTVKGPIGKFVYKTNCTNKRVVDFFVNLQETQQATLDYGDGNTVSITGNATGTVNSTKTHTYLASGDYTAVLTSTNNANGCGVYTYTALVRVRAVKADFTVTPVMCKGGAVTFTAINSVDVFVSSKRGYAWLFDNAAPQQTDAAVPTYTFDAPGTHTATLWVKDVNSCVDTLTKTFIIDSPTPSFTFNANPACIGNMPVQIINTTPQAPVASNSFTWDFGNSTYSITSSSTISPMVTYTATKPSQSYVITMTASSTYFGCLETCSFVLQVNNPPNVSMYPSRSNACVNETLSFNEFIQGTPPSVMTKTINFGDNSPPIVNNYTVPSYVHTYTAAGQYTFSFVLADEAGCKNTYSNTIIIENVPKADFIYYATLNPSNVGPVFCAPISISFSSTSISDAAITYAWDLNTGSPIVPQPVVGTLYTGNSVKTVSLIVRTILAGCSSKMTHTLAILNPTANVVADKNTFCLGETITLSIKDSSGISGWSWFYGDGASSGTLMANAAPSRSISYVYQDIPPPFGSGIINLVYFARGYLCPTSATLGVYVVKVDADFKRNTEASRPDSMHCLNIQDLFTNSSKKNNSTNIDGLSFNWDMGNGVTSTSMSTNYTYPQPGVYSVTLTVKDPLLGCTDVSVKNMTINPLPTVSISVPDSTCQGSVYTLNSTASADVSQYQWQPPEGLTNPTQAVTTATALASNTYSLLVSNIYSCTATSNTEYMYVQPPPPRIRWDTTVIIGQYAILNSNLGPLYSYTWSPLTDLNCEHCPFPTSTSTANITYSVQVEDVLKCFRVVNTYSVLVDPQTTIDVPTAFTPNQDGLNDKIYVDGWGIKRLNYFRIFNRWGQLLFETNDIKEGWDGTYQGVEQNMETYVYQVSGDTYLAGKSLQKTGTFRLIR